MIENKEKEEFYTKVADFIASDTTIHNIVRKFFDFGVAYGEWEAGYGCDPRRMPDLVKEVLNEE